MPQPKQPPMISIEEKNVNKFQTAVGSPEKWKQARDKVLMKSTKKIENKFQTKLLGGSCDMISLTLPGGKMEKRSRKDNCEMIRYDMIRNIARGTTYPEY